MSRLTLQGVLLGSLLVLAGDAGAGNRLRQARRESADALSTSVHTPRVVYLGGAKHPTARIELMDTGRQVPNSSSMELMVVHRSANRKQHHVQHTNSPYYRRGETTRQFWMNSVTGDVRYSSTNVVFANNGSMETAGRGRQSVLYRYARAVDQRGEPIVVEWIQRRNSKGQFTKASPVQYWRPRAETAGAVGAKPDIWDASYQPPRIVPTVQVR